MPLDARFAPQHKWDRAFFVAFTIVAWIAVIAGFREAVESRLGGHADYRLPLILRLHIGVFVAWLALFTAQVLLINRRKLTLHRRLGLTAVALLPVMVVSSIGAEAYSQHIYSPHWPGNLKLFIDGVMQTAIYAACIAAALLTRNDGPTHKRLMVMGTSMVTAAAFNRLWGAGLYHAMGDEFWGTLVRLFVGPDLMMACAALYDLATRGRVHRIYLIALPLIFIAELITSFIYHDPAWPGFVRQLLGISPL